MSKRILDKVKDYFQATLEVNFYETVSTASVSSCQSTEIPQLTNEQIDLYIVIKPENDESKSYFAAASSCAKSDVDARPYTGIYFLNFAGMKVSKLKEFLYFSTFAHELTHIFGFSSSLYGTYKQADGSTDRPEAEVVQGKSIPFVNPYFFR